MAIKVDMEVTGSCRRKLSLEVPVEDVNAAFDRVLAGFAKHVSVPGFRKGRVPTPILERRFGKEILEKVRDSVVPQACHRALKDRGLRSLGVIDFQPPEIARDKSAAFSIIIETAPEFELPDYKSYSFEIPLEPVTDENAQEMFDSLRRQHATFEDVTDRPAETDDLVQVDFTGTLDGRPIEEVEPGAKGLGQASGFWVSLNEHAFLPGFADGLKGALIGDERAIRSGFPATFTVKGLAGKTAEYRVTVKGIRHSVPPEMNAEFFSLFFCASEEELRNTIRRQLTSMYEDQREEKIRNAILEKLLADVRIEGLPEAQVQQETQRAIYSTVRMNSARGISQDQIREQKDHIFEIAAKTAQERIKVRHILTRIAEAEDVRVSDEDVDQRVRMEAHRQGVSEKAYRKQLEDAESLDAVREKLLVEAVLRKLREKVAVTG